MMYRYQILENCLPNFNEKTTELLATLSGPGEVNAEVSVALQNTKIAYSLVALATRVEKAQVENKNMGDVSLTLSQLKDAIPEELFNAESFGFTENLESGATILLQDIFKARATFQGITHFHMYYKGIRAGYV